MTKARDEKKTNECSISSEIQRQRKGYGWKWDGQEKRWMKAKCES